MGGGYYDRDSDNTALDNNSNNIGYSNLSNQMVGKVHEINQIFDPMRFKSEKLVSTHANPIVFALDVTGSMGEWVKIVYDKLPMFYGQIMLQKYLNDPSLSFCAIGDVKTDEAPLQVSNFYQGCELDEVLCKIYLEGKGGGNEHESYDLGAYFYSEKVNLINQDIPFFFLTCDEKFWEECRLQNFKKVFGHPIENNNQQIVSKYYWSKILNKYNFFVLRKSFKKKIIDLEIKIQWERMIGKERVLHISEPKAVIDVILGAICITSGAKDLKGYVNDMVQRGQTKQRISEVKEALLPYWTLISTHPNKIIRNENYSKSTEYKTEKQLNVNDNFENNFNCHEYIKKAFFESNEYNENQKIQFKNYIKLCHELKDKVPEDLICPLTSIMYFDPVKTPNGKVYERLAIYDVIKISGKDPSLNTPLEKSDLETDINTKINSESFYDSVKIIMDI